jgi:ADP-heptose:LPS heptosyltransferase
MTQNMHLAAFFASEPEIARQKPVFPKLFRADEQDKADNLVAAYKQKTFVAVHAGSSADHSMIHKRWPAKRFAALADRICAKMNAAALIVGGTEERDIKQTVVSAMNTPCFIVDALPLGVTSALLSKCALCLCNDSGIMHLASCAGTPTIAIFGPTDEKRNGPAGAHGLVVRKAMSGFPLWTARNVGNRSVSPSIDPGASLKALSVEEAWKQIESWLENLIRRQ